MQQLLVGDCIDRKEGFVTKSFSKNTFFYNMMSSVWDFLNAGGMRHFREPHLIRPLNKLVLPNPLIVPLERWYMHKHLNVAICC